MGVGAVSESLPPFRTFLLLLVGLFQPYYEERCLVLLHLIMLCLVCFHEGKQRIGGSVREGRMEGDVWRNEGREAVPGYII